MRQLFGKAKRVKSFVVGVVVGENFTNSTLTSSQINGSIANSGSRINNVDKIPPFKLSQSDLEGKYKVNQDKRVYIDEFKEVGEGRLYKGQWNKKSGERDGLGI